MEGGGERKTKAEMGPDGDDPLPIGNKDAENEPQPAAEESADKPKPSAAVDGGGEKESPLDPNFRTWSDHDLSDTIARMKGGLKRMGTNLPDGGEKLRVNIMRYEAELQSRKIRRDDEKCRELVQSINNGTCAGELKLRPTDTINTQSLKRMKIIKSQGQWVAQTKGFDPTSRSSTLPFEDEEEKEEEEAEDVPQVPGAPTDIPGSSAPRSSSSRFTFTEDYYNLLNGRIDSLTSTVDGLGGILHQIQVQQDQIQAQQDAILAQQAAMQARQNDFYAHFYRSSSSRFTFTEDYYNLLNGRIDSLTSTVDGLGGILHQIQVQQDQIQAQQDAILAQQAAMQARQNDFYAHFPLSPHAGL